jgi:hypothetical protein
MALKMVRAMVRESVKALALLLVLWSLMVMVWVLALAQYLRNNLTGYRMAKYRICKWCKAGHNHPHNKVVGCNPYPQKTDLNYPSRLNV